MDQVVVGVVVVVCIFACERCSYDQGNFNLLFLPFLLPPLTIEYRLPVLAKLIGWPVARQGEDHILDLQLVVAMARGYVCM